MKSSFYDIYSSYENNYINGPAGPLKLKKPQRKNLIPKYKFLGFPINIPFGIPAGPLINSKFIKEAFELGFDVSTYKTVRSDAFPCHPYPNVVYVEAPDKLIPQITPQLIAKGTASGPISKISITNSFGVPSKTPSVWKEDVKKALKYERKGQILILSFMGTVKPNQTQDEFVEDFIKAAKIASQTGAKILEVNLSCPNIGNEGLVCYNLETTGKICKAIRKVIKNKPLIIKVGYYNNEKDIERLAEIAERYASAIAAINTLQTEIVDKDGKQALPGKNRLRSGVCGHSIKWAGLEMVQKLNKIRKNKNYKFEIVGIGGVMTPNDYLEYRKAGADLVQSATGAMWNPCLALEIINLDNK